MNVHISKGNQKLGGIYNVSLPPIQTCIDNPPCATLCYARKAYEGYAKNTTGPAWDENLALYQQNPLDYFDQIDDFLGKQRKKPIEYFRWHVGGDIPDLEYFGWMRYLAGAYPNIHFLAYSRRDWAWGKDMNLNVLRSYWLGEKPDREAGFVVIPKGESAPAGELCPGSCATCKACWHLPEGHHRYIHLH